MFIPEVNVDDVVMYYPMLSEHSKVSLESMAQECLVTKANVGPLGMIEVKYQAITGNFLRFRASYSESIQGGVWTKVVRKAGEAQLQPRTNGGVQCDMDDGPCACGAWHKPDHKEVTENPVVTEPVTVALEDLLVQKSNILFGSVQLPEYSFDSNTKTFFSEQAKIGMVVANPTGSVTIPYDLRPLDPVVGYAREDSAPAFVPFNYPADDREPYPVTYTVTITTEAPLDRSQLIAIAHDIAVKHAKKHGTVTATDVWAGFKRRKVNVTGHDPRWLGGVFRSNKQWKRVGYQATGSHGRPVAVWALR